MGNLWLDPPAGMKPLRMITWPDSNHDIATAFFEFGGSDDSPRHLAVVTDDAEAAAARTGFLTLFETSGEPRFSAFAKAKMIRWHTPAALADAVTKYLQRELNTYVALTWVRPTPTPEQLLGPGVHGLKSVRPGVGGTCCRAVFSMM